MLLLSLLLAIPSLDGLAITAPRLGRGEELVYTGEVIEAGERIGNRFRKKHDLEVRLLVLDVREGTACCAVLTCLRSRSDPAVASGAALATGTDPTVRPVPPTVRLDLVRIDSQGRIVALVPNPGPPPLFLSNTTPTASLAPIPLNGPPILEVGLILPLPAKPVILGTTWETQDPQGPPQVWTAVRDRVWNGSRCVEVSGTQKSDGYDRPALAVTGWRRTDTLTILPSDGYACSVDRKIERREGAAVVGWVEVTYSLQTVHRHHGDRFQEIRREVETTVWFTGELAQILAQPGPVSATACRSLARKIEAFTADRLVKTGFHEALESVGRRCEAAARGEAVPRPVPIAASREAPTIGKPAPDFVAPLVHSAQQVRLSGLRPRPTVLVFYKPGSRTASAALTVAEALHQLEPDRLAVVAVAVSASADAAHRERDERKLTVPVVEGSRIRELYGVDSYPRFLVVDAAGLLAWQFVGYGPEVGYLVKEQVEKVLSGSRR